MSIVKEEICKTSWNQSESEVRGEMQNDGENSCARVVNLARRQHTDLT